MKILLSEDEYRASFEWLEDHLEEAIFVLPIDDLIALEEQVFADQNLTKK